MAQYHARLYDDALLYCRVLKPGAIMHGAKNMNHHFLWSKDTAALEHAIYACPQRRAAYIQQEYYHNLTMQYISLCVPVTNAV